MCGMEQKQNRERERKEKVWVEKEFSFLVMLLSGLALSIGLRKKSSDQCFICLNAFNRRESIKPTNLDKINIFPYFVKINVVFIFLGIMVVI